LELRLLRDVVLDGSGIDRAQADRDMTLGQWTVSVTFNEAGSRRLFEVTRDNIDRRLAMVVDGQIITAPVIRSAVRDSAEINGAFDRARAEELAKAINDAARTASTQSSR
jgi:SecD/SecF fusion protein